MEYLNYYKRKVIFMNKKYKIELYIEIDSEKYIDKDYIEYVIITALTESDANIICPGDLFNDIEVTNFSEWPRADE